MDALVARTDRHTSVFWTLPLSVATIVFSFCDAEIQLGMHALSEDGFSDWANWEVTARGFFTEIASSSMSGPAALARSATGPTALVAFLSRKLNEFPFGVRQGGFYGWRWSGRARSCVVGYTHRDIAKLRKWLNSNVPFPLYEEQTHQIFGLCHIITNYWQ